MAAGEEETKASLLSLLNKGFSYLSFIHVFCIVYNVAAGKSRIDKTLMLWTKRKDDCVGLRLV